MALALALATSDCDLGIPAVFANPESPDCRRSNPGISGLQVLFQ